MSRFIIIAAYCVASALAASADDDRGEPAEPQAVFNAHRTDWLNADEIVPASAVSDDPEPIDINEGRLDLFQPREAETPQGEAPAEPAPTTPETVFNGTPSAQQSFHRVYDFPWRVPYLGPRGGRDPSLGTTNTWVPHPCQASHGNYYQSADGSWLGNDKYCDVSGVFNDSYDSAVRFGWWGINNDGSLTKVGEYQDLDSSPFWDIDLIRSDGERTIDLWMSGLDEDANSARGSFYFGPGFSAKIRYERFLHRLDHDPLYGKPITEPPLLPADNVVTEELNVGEDYAIRVQQLDTRFQGRINEDLKWRVNVWWQRKFGERQANATAHCFDVNPDAMVTNNVCHVLSQRQNVDWQTFEIQPVLEARFGDATVEYSHTLRAFGQDDQVVNRIYDHFAPFIGPPFPYGFVPDTNTNIDRVKLGWNLNDENHIYGNAYYGLTENTFRETSRQYTGFDLRYTNRMLDRLTWTAYVNTNAENNENAPFLILGDPPPANPLNRQIKHPVDHIRTRAGIKGNWQPLEGLEDRLSIAGGYEYFQHERDFATYYVTAIPPPSPVPFSQPDTSSNMIELGPQVRWSRALSSYIRYKAWFVDEPLLGVREGDGQFNTNQPEQEHRVEIGGAWNPASNFMTTAQVSLVNRWNRSQYADFSEDSYPFTWTMWYAPTQKLSLSGGYGYYSNWIDQDITLGYRFNLADQTETTRWNYAGENHIVNVNLAYAWRPTVQFVAGYEWSRGNNVFTVPASPAGADWSQLASFSDVLIEQNRITAGADWQPFDNITLYARYIYFDWNDIAADLDSGTTHIALAGAGVIF